MYLDDQPLSVVAVGVGVSVSVGPVGSVGIGVPISISQPGISLGLWLGLWLGSGESGKANLMEEARLGVELCREGWVLPQERTSL